MNGKLLEELETISAANGGRPTPENVLFWARRHKKSAIWDYLEQDPQQGLVKYQLWQCRKLIAGAIIELENVHDNMVRTRRFVSLIHDRAQGGGYRDIRDVLDSKVLCEQLLESAYADAQKFKEKYQMLKELKGVVAAIDELPTEKKRKKRKAG